jgi:hypothetical protein
VLFAPGGSGKSYLSLAAAVTIASGVPVFGTPVAAPGAVLYLDWETDSWTFAARLRALCKGAGVAPVPPIYYRHMVGSLAEGLHAVHREVARLGVIAAFVDSLATARGGEPESAEVTNRLFTAMRSIDRPVFGVDHVSKAAMKDDPGSGGRLSPFGSVFTENRARNTWSVRRAGEEDGDEFDVALVHEKTNNGRYQKRHAYHLVFVNTSDAQGEERLDSVTIRPAELGRIAAFEATQTLPERILRYMRDSRDGTATPDEVAGALGIDRSKIAPRLSELRSTGKVVYLAGRQRYGLTTHRGDRGA